MSGRGSSFITVKYLLKLLSALHNSDWVSGEQTGSAFVMIVGIFHEWIIIQRMDKHPNCVEIACLSDQITHFLNLSAEDDTSKTLQQIWWKDLKMRSFSKVKNDISASTFNPTWMRCPWSTQNEKRKKKNMIPTITLQTAWQLGRVHLSIEKLVWYDQKLWKDYLFF